MTSHTLALLHHAAADSLSSVPPDTGKARAILDELSAHLDQDPANNIARALQRIYDYVTSTLGAYEKLPAAPAQRGPRKEAAPDLSEAARMIATLADAYTGPATPPPPRRATPPSPC